MVRILRYPRLCVFGILMTFACALGRDACVGAGLEGWANILLYATVLGILGCFVLMSCRLTVDEGGIGVGFLLGTRYTDWHDFAALGALLCNSRRVYLYGLYRGAPDFLHMLRRAPQCGPWGFVAPMNKKLERAVKIYCPYRVELTPPKRQARPRAMRCLWHQTVFYAILMLPSSGVAFSTAVMMLRYGAQAEGNAALWLMLGAAAMGGAGAFLLSRLAVTFMTRPFISEEGVRVGVGLYLPWSDVRFAYVQRMGHMSGMFFLSQPVEAMTRLGAPPVICLSVPDTSTLILAYLTYCPHASRQGMEI